MGYWRFKELAINVYDKMLVNAKYFEIMKLK